MMVYLSFTKTHSAAGNTLRGNNASSRWASLREHQFRSGRPRRPGHRPAPVPATTEWQPPATAGATAPLPARPNLVRNQRPQRRAGPRRPVQSLALRSAWSFKKTRQRKKSKKRKKAVLYPSRVQYLDTVPSQRFPRLFQDPLTFADGRHISCKHF